MVVPYPCQQRNIVGFKVSVSFTPLLFLAQLLQRQKTDGVESLVLRAACWGLLHPLHPTK